MNHIKTYSQLLKIRTVFKRVQQLSWNLNKVENRYNIDELAESDQEALIETYFSYIDELQNILDELQNAKKDIKQ